jgi:hypothetical protein
LIENIHLTETLGSAYNTVESNLTGINQEYKISETLVSVGEGIKDSVCIYVKIDRIL